MPNLLVYNSIGSHQQGREGGPAAWTAQGLHTSCPGLLCPGEHLHNTGGKRLPVSSSSLFGVEMMHLTGQLTPASSWAAPSQLGAVLPQPACFIGCMKLRDFILTSGL
ncbi:Hypothetical predicted protein [Xyrichtys novacula]|uniref:Uncharacterized protein n=1 Tax=Xyrichtys novacula TaxID=13765 RepID=A0AAV1H158_XYRNO|nr:Hypothetical predicted protein [Xyrichtys novacula]